MLIEKDVAGGDTPAPLRESRTVITPCVHPAGAALRFLAIAMGSLTLAACGGGGGDSGGGSNQPPSASFTATPTTGQAPLTVSLDASASRDPDGSIASYNWIFGDNSTGSGGPTATHIFQSAGTYTITLNVQDNRGAVGSTTRQVTVSAGPAPANVVVSGRITYDRVPFSLTFGSGLDYARTEQKPARGVVVEIVRSNGSVANSVTTDESGNYSTSAPANTDVLVRAKAQWSTEGNLITVRNNTNSNAVYGVEGSTFNTQAVNHTRNLHAPSGWASFGGTSYVSARLAAPFAVLDTISRAIQFLADAQVLDLSTGEVNLNVYWSTQNRPSDTFDAAAGNIVTTTYRPADSSGGPAGIYVLGVENNDTDEYDQHIVAHEVMHYWEDKYARSDTPGGSHSIGEKLDLRLAFGEGFANAFAGMVLDDPEYRDSFGRSQGEDGGFSLDSNNFRGIAGWEPGWFDEGSVLSIAWDLFDAAGVEANDNVSIHPSVLLSVISGDVATGPALTSLFPFISALKKQTALTEPAVAAVNQIVAAQNIVATTMTPFAETETNDGGNRDGLPLYTPITVNGPAVFVCSNTDSGSVNKLANTRFLRFTMPAAAAVDILVSVAAVPVGEPKPDPDLFLYRAGFFDSSKSESGAVAPFTERYQKSIPAGEYVLEVYDYGNISTEADVTRRSRTCMTVTVKS